MNEIDIRPVADKYNFINLGPQKMAGMVSYSHGHYRINIYTTTGTVQIQLVTEEYDRGVVYKNVTLPELDKIFKDLT